MIDVLINKIKDACYHIPSEFCKSNEMMSIYIKGITNGREQAIKILEASNDTNS
jgi:hypothetical protein